MVYKVDKRKIEEKKAEDTMINVCIVGWGLGELNEYRGLNEGRKKKQMITDLYTEEIIIVLLLG